MGQRFSSGTTDQGGPFFAELRCRNGYIVHDNKSPRSLGSGSVETTNYLPLTV
jgi:hypothetical protein